MPKVINGKTYYTFEEASLISDKTIKNNAIKFAKNVLKKQEENTLVKEISYA